MNREDIVKEIRERDRFACASNPRIASGDIEFGEHYTLFDRHTLLKLYDEDQQTLLDLTKNNDSLRDQLFHMMEECTSLRRQLAPFEIEPRAVTSKCWYSR